MDHTNGSARLTDPLKYYSTTFYSMHRKEPFRSCYQAMISIDADLYFSELLHSCLSLIHGKAKKLDRLYLVRQGFAAKEYEVLDVFEWIGTPDWGKQYERFRDCLAEQLRRGEDIAITEAREIIKKAFSQYLSAGLKVPLTKPTGPNGLRRLMRSLPGARPVWQALRALDQRERVEITLPLLLRPPSPYHADFMPIYRAITAPSEELAFLLR